MRGVKVVLTIRFNFSICILLASGLLTPHCHAKKGLQGPNWPGHKDQKHTKVIDQRYPAIQAEGHRPKKVTPGPRDQSCQKTHQGHYKVL